MQRHRALPRSTGASLGLPVSLVSAAARGNEAATRGWCLVVDLRQVTFMVCSPLGVLCSAQVRAGRGGGRLRLVYTQVGIIRLLAAAALQGRFPRHATVADALADPRNVSAAVLALH